MSQPTLEILYEDEHLLVVDKPSGLLSVPTPGAQGRTVLDVLARLGKPALAVHRLDRDVSGALLVARDTVTRDALQDLFRARALSKIYWALVLGGPSKESGEIRFPIAESGASARVSSTGKPSLTRYEVRKRGPIASEVEVELETGRYNQIRIHFAHSGWPLVGERKYARTADDPYRAPRVALHAWRLAFEHPHTKAPITAVAPLPDKLAELRQRVLYSPAPTQLKSLRPATNEAEAKRRRRASGRSDSAVAKRAQNRGPGKGRGGTSGGARGSKR